jgi:hypothetical protein
MKIGLMMLAAVLMYQVNAVDSRKIRMNLLVNGARESIVLDILPGMTYRQLREEIARELVEKHGVYNYAITREILDHGRDGRAVTIEFNSAMLDQPISEDHIFSFKTGSTAHIALKEYDSVDHIPNELCSDLQMAKKLRSSWIRGVVSTSQEKDLVLIERQLKDVFGYEYDRIVALTLKEKQAIIETGPITED